MQEVIEDASCMEVVRTCAVTTLALIYGNTDQMPEAERLLTKHGVSHSIMQALDTCIHGDCMYAQLRWNLKDVLKVLESVLARTALLACGHMGGLRPRSSGVRALLYCRNMQDDLS